jgi:hypothetical protein
MTSFPWFASVNLYSFAVVAASLCRGAGGERYHSEGTAAQRRGYNTCHATGLRLLRNRDGKGVRGANAVTASVLAAARPICLVTVCSGPLLPPACSSQAAHWRFWEFSDQAIRRDNNVDSIDTLQYAREIAGQRANSPASFGRST